MHTGVRSCLDPEGWEDCSTELSVDTFAEAFQVSLALGTHTYRLAFHYLPENLILLSLHCSFPWLLFFTCTAAAIQQFFPMPCQARGCPYTASQGAVPAPLSFGPSRLCIAPLFWPSKPLHPLFLLLLMLLMLLKSLDPQYCCSPTWWMLLPLTILQSFFSVHGNSAMISALCTTWQNRSCLSGEGGEELNWIKVSQKNIWVWTVWNNERCQ